MVPPVFRLWRHPRRFPRPRGDGPHDLDGRLPEHWVSPPARGWSHQTMRAADDAVGFPARAGMVRYNLECLGKLKRFPRPRGDGPSRARIRLAGLEVSPPARGWSPISMSPRPILGGFPARAGMVPRWRPQCLLFRRFPRPRGDGPPNRSGCARCDRVSPPARGWSAISVFRLARAGGFPARAGMVRLGKYLMKPMPRFPRPRGDGPRPHRSHGGCATVSPPARGWSLLRNVLAVLDAGFPARAGMVPALITCPVFEVWFPRPRGDGPLQNIEKTS